jgi:hypothetical protein
MSTWRIVLTEKQELMNKIQEKEAQLSQTQRESETWSKSKYKHSSNTLHSKIFVKSLRDEISKLYSQLNNLS